MRETETPLDVRCRSVDRIGSPAPTLVESKKWRRRTARSRRRAAYPSHGWTFARLFGVTMCSPKSTYSGYASTTAAAAVQSTSTA